MTGEQEDSQVIDDAALPMIQTAQVPMESVEPKLGWWTFMITVLSSVTLLLSAAFLIFLWLAWDNNSLWHMIAMHDRMTQAVTVASAVLRTAVSIQATLATSMLAGWALERGQVGIQYLPIVSIMRVSTSGPFELSWYMLPTRGRVLLPLLIVTLCLTGLTLQFSSAILISDIHPGWISSGSNALVVKASLINGTASNLIVTTGTTSRWQTRPQQFPTFAERRRDDAIHSGDGIVDTGTTLRAFLPITDSSTRAALRSYSGAAAVVDFRTICMRPEVSISPRFLDPPMLGGNLSIIEERLKRPLGASGDESWRIVTNPLKNLKFNCTLPGIGSRTRGLADSFAYQDADWAISLCHLSNQNDIFLSPEFFDMDGGRYYKDTADRFQTRTYLVINQTRSINGDVPVYLNASNITRQDPAGHWLNLYLDARKVVESGAYETHISLSLCITPTYGIVANVSATSLTNRTEPVPRVRNTYPDFADIRRQMGQDRTLSNSDRGILDLEDQDWIIQNAQAKNAGKPNPMMSFLTTATLPRTSSLGSSIGSVSVDPPISIRFSYNRDIDVHVYDILNDIFADSYLAMLFQEILKAGGSLPFALQSVFTVLAGMAYYDQAPLFDDQREASQRLFKQCQIPGGLPHYRGGPAGFLPGLTTVLCVLAVHCITVSFVAWMFFFKTSISSLHNSWQTVAQLNSAPLDDYLSRAALADDKEVDEWIDADYDRPTYTGISTSWDGVGTEITGCHPRKSHSIQADTTPDDDIELDQLPGSATASSGDQPSRRSVSLPEQVDLGR